LRLDGSGNWTMTASGCRASQRSTRAGGGTAAGTGSEANSTTASATSPVAVAKRHPGDLSRARSQDAPSALRTLNDRLTSIAIRAGTRKARNTVTCSNSHGNRMPPAPRVMSNARMPPAR